MPNWDSLNPNPPSLLFPPDSSKWWMRRNIPGTRIETAPNGSQVCIAEVRGWLRWIDPGCTRKDPDWHYQFEVDTTWLASLGISLEGFFLPGDPIANQDRVSAAVNAEVSSRSSARAIWGEPIIHVEVDGWQRHDTDRGQPTQPSTWTFTNTCTIEATNATAVWPYDPQHPNPSDPALAPGQYLRVVGSLCTDEPHMSYASNVSTYLMNFGYAATVGMYGQQAADDAQLSVIKQLWSGSKGETAEDNPARYNEIHSPDFFQLVTAPVRTEIVRALAIVAKSDVFSGETEELSAEIQALPRSTRWQVLGCEKHVGPATLSSTVQVDDMTILSNSVRVHVKVQAQGGLGANGKCFALYRVAWRTLAPRLSAAVSTNASTALVATDTDGKVVVRSGSAVAPYWPSAWSSVALGDGAQGGGAAVASRNAGYFDAFIVGKDSVVHTAATSGAAWSGWWTIPGIRGIPGSSITAISRSKDKLDVFVADAAGKVMSAAWEPSFTGWHGWWQVINGATAPGGSVTAVSRRTDFLDIFTVGTDGHVYTAAWSPTAASWGGWWPIPGITVPAGAPIACVSRSTDKIDLFVADAQGRLMTSAWSPTTGVWAAWTQVLGGMTAPGAPIAAVSRRTDYLDVFHIGNDGQVYSAALSAGTWGGWWPIPGIKCQFATPIVALSPQQDLLIVVTTTQDGNMVSTSWKPGMATWSAWSSIS